MDRIIGMLLRMVMRKVMNKGIDMLATRQDSDRPLTKQERTEQRLQKRRLQEQGQQVKRAAKVMRRIGRF